MPNRLTERKLEAGKKMYTLRIAVVLAFVISTASAQDVKNECFSYEAPLDSRLAACTVIIDSGKASDPVLAAAYCSRGFGLTEKRELNLAMVDLDRSIKLDPKNACAYSNRGRV